MIDFQRIYKGVSLEELDNDVKNKHDLALLLENHEEEIEEG